MKQKVALVLSSGGARGYAHVGVIEALESNGFQITSVAGCSMGAVVGGIYATGQLQKFKDWAMSLERSDVFKLYDFVFSSQGLIRGEKVFRQIEQYIPDCNIEDLPIPFTAVATDLKKESEMIFKTGSLYNALHASSAIPAVVKPAIVDDNELLDGGILNPLPIDHVHRTPGDILVVVDVNSRKINVPVIPVKTEEEIKNDRVFKNSMERLAKRWFRKESPVVNHTSKKLGFFNLMLKSIDMMQDQLTAQILKAYPPDILIEISRASCGTFEYYKAAEMIEAGKKAFETTCHLSADKNAPWTTGH